MATFGAGSTETQQYLQVPSSGPSSTSVRRPISGAPVRGTVSTGIDSAAAALCTPQNPQIEAYIQNAGSGAGVNGLIKLQTPRRTILFKGNDGGGGTIVFLHFTPIQPDPSVGGGPSTGDQMTMFTFQPFTPGLPINPIATFGFLRFDSPISQFYVSWEDTGQPGSNFVFQATDDLDDMIAGRRA